ncbi:MAG: hypothetical protein GDA43_01440 [Hormoscilla sp. SP5CHS1]|nr:hypothetical protein [Hormoscilla sp. SP12CHS1]MBC6452016.1 hypothetical protein [Hormoscilla sp. SP5CHS1]MBC6475049.1 hypothetical protein [Hormoscilla sp. GM102CHS1]
MSVFLLADRIVVLDNSPIVEVGDRAQLMANDGLYARMFRLQASSYNLQESIANS